MDFLNLFQRYWPFRALGLWLAYKWWNSKRVIAMRPGLGDRLGEIPKSSALVLCCASGTRSGMAKMLLRKNGYQHVHNIGAWSKFSN
jgi:rhodanese-related sulfurtransferase